MALASEQDGYIKLSRGFFKRHRFWLERVKFHRREAWIDLIQDAAFLPYTRIINKEPVVLDRGEIVGSLRFYADRWMWSVKEVRGFFANLERNQEIRAQRRAQAGTVYLLVTYDEYQDLAGRKGTPKGKARAQRGHKGEGSDKEVKEIKETDILFDVEWLDYPKKVDKQKALAAWDALIAKKEDPREIAAGIRRYTAYVKADQTPMKFIKHLSTLLGKSGAWREPWTVELRVLPQAVNGPPQFDYSNATTKFKGFTK